jgi:hypothetical protein
VVYYAVSGTASGSDRNTLPGNVAIPAGSPSTTIQVMPVDDALVEPD